MTVDRAVVEELVGIVGAAHVLTDPDVRASYEVDWTGRFRGTTPAVVRPSSTAEVAAVLEVCARRRLPIVPQGGNTGLVGGGVPRRGELVLSLRRLTRLDPVDAGGTVVVGAGVTLESLQDHAAVAGWQFGIDLAARGSATVGGLVSTDAAGLQHLRHGSMRRQVLAVEAVLADGAVLSRLDGPPKDNAGYDLAGLLTGSEGTLGVVTAARLALVAPVVDPVAALIGSTSLAAAVDVTGRLRRSGVAVHAAEVFLENGLDLVCRHLGVGRPMGPHPVYLLVEWDGRPEELEILGDVDAVIATDTASRASLWRYREAHTEAINATGVPHKLDVGVEPEDLDALLAEVTAAVAALAPTASVIVFGHVADGNVHVNVIGPDADDETIDDAILELVVARHGSISAEHGIGTAKRRWLPLVRSPAELSSYRRIKEAFDPAGILNPNVLLY